MRLLRVLPLASWDTARFPRADRSPLRVAGHPPLRTLQPVALSSRMWISSSCFAFGFVIVVSLVCRGASQQGAARQEREVCQDGARLVRRQDEVCRVV
jgi:hypothetical protein